MKIRLLFLLIFSCFQVISAQQQMALESMNDFRSQAGNWQIVGEVLVDRNIDIHSLEKNESDVKTKKRKRKSKKETEMPKPVSFVSGKGILLNINDSEKRDRLLTKWEHGDIKLDLEVMLPKGSNSGIYLQGRYELQIKDSWGVKNPKMHDMGGIHNNWETQPDKIFRGIAPLSNASKAPGLWQKLSIHFQAPRFNDSGEKIANAKFVLVTLNGVPIHTNVEVPHYTGGPISKEEVAKGPLMIQGDHGPVAFRNISYQLLEESGVTLSSLKYKTYKGNFKGLEELNDASVVFEEESNLIDVNVSGEEDEYGIVYTGLLNIPNEDTYTLSVGFTGGVNLLIDDKSVIKRNSSDSQEHLDATMKLTAGMHKFSLTNIKAAEWRAPRLGFFIKSATSNSKSFNVYDSYPPSVNSVSPIFVQPDSEPRLLRAFVNFKENERLSHTIGVGTPQGINYVYNLGSGNLIGVWRGDFVDATPMWHDRGNGSFNPKGAVVWTFLNQSIAQLSNLNSEFPKTGIAPDYVSKGYSIDKATKLPIFKHIYKDVEIENIIIPDSSNTYATNEIRFSKSGLTNWYCKLASGEVKKMPDGSYAINDQQYYIKILTEQIPIVREVNETTELVIPVNGNTVKYEIIW